MEMQQAQHYYERARQPKLWLNIPDSQHCAGQENRPAAVRTNDRAVFRRSIFGERIKEKRMGGLARKVCISQTASTEKFSVYYKYPLLFRTLWMTNTSERNDCS
jgi:hypothetical protein